MAVGIEALSTVGLGEQTKVLEKMAKHFLTFEESFNGGVNVVDIEVDGTVYSIPKPVCDLLDTIYKMYKREVILRVREK